MSVSFKLFRSYQRGASKSDLRYKILLPRTREAKCAYIQIVSAKQTNLVQRATHFISHTWQYPFLAVVKSLAELFKGKNKKNIYIWFDALCNNQHVAINRDFEWWTGTFKTAIEDFQHTVLVLAPWKDPIPLRRAWCLFEIYCTAITKFDNSISL